MSFKFQKGQGATEYLVLLAVVLIVAMVAIALLGFFPGLSYDAKKSEADAYWRSVKPFQIVGHTIPSTGGNLTLVLQNAETDQMQLKQISVAGSGYSGQFNSTNSFLSGGATSTYLIDLSQGGVVTPCVSGTIYEIAVNFTYKNTGTGLDDLTEPGTKNIVGKCS